MYFFDSHAHLQDDRIWDDIDQVMMRARNAGVVSIVCCGSTESDWERVAELSKRFSMVIPAFGVHPWYVRNCSSTWLDTLEQILISYPKSIVGEIGLDHALEKRNDREQTVYFEEQLKLATRLHRPVSVHCRKAWGDLLSILKKQPGVPYGGAIHSYSGAPDLIDQLVNIGFSISFSGSVTYDRNKRARNSALRVPIDRLLLETDTPDILPIGYSGHNEPAAIIDIAKSVARIRDMTIEECSQITTNNGKHLFVL